MAIKRLWEIDFLRGIALLMMFIFHFAWDLNYFNLVFVSFYSGFWLVFQRTIAFLFIGLVGVSLSLAFSKIRPKKDFYKKSAKRAAQIFGSGLVITLVSYLLFPEQTVYFGILHFIGISILIAMFFAQYKYVNLVLAGILFLLKNIAETTLVKTKYLIWLGLKYPSFATLDYYPLIPWLGIVFVGLFLGNYFYHNGKRRFTTQKINKKITKIANPISFLGKHTLLLYILHLPILFGLAYLLKYML